MIKLEEITKETCESQFSASLAICPTEREEHCLNCPSVNYEYCDRYKPLSNSAKRYAYMRLYKRR